jgi:hypothetical protein
MGSNHWPLILIEVVLVFGGALAFGWWQFRDLARERKKREAQREAQRGSSASPNDRSSGPTLPPASQGPHAAPSELSEKKPR